jgi:hypothetical protein
LAMYMWEIEYRVGVWRMGFREGMSWLPGVGYIDRIEWRMWRCVLPGSLER